MYCGNFLKPSSRKRAVLAWVFAVPARNCPSPGPFPAGTCPGVSPHFSPGLHRFSLSFGFGAKPCIPPHSTYCSRPEPSWAFSKWDWMNHVPCYVTVFLLNSSQCHPWMSGCLVENVSRFFPLGREHVQRDRIFSYCQNLARLPSLLRDMSHAYFQKAGSLPTPLWTPWGRAVRETRVCVPMGHSQCEPWLEPSATMFPSLDHHTCHRGPLLWPPWVVWPHLQLSWLPSRLRRADSTLAAALLQRCPQMI